MKTKKPDELGVGDKLFCLHRANNDKYIIVQTWEIVRVRRSRYGNASLYLTRTDPPISGAPDPHWLFGTRDVFGPAKTDVNSDQVNRKGDYFTYHAFFTTKTGAVRHAVRVAKNNARMARRRLQEAEREEATTLRLIARMQAAAKNKQKGK